MKNCLHAFTKWIICLLAVVAINDLSAQNVRDGFCDIAVDVTCGVAITNQTTVGSQNFLTKYVDCNNYTFAGPEKAYKVTTTSAGNIQVDLTIAASDVDLDILLLTNDCSAPVCVAQSISSNANTRNEVFTYSNAPAGTYYVIVDSEKDAGAFSLLVTCNAVTPPSGCNLEYTTTANHVSCGGSSGSIDVAIAWGTAPFKIEWDNSSGTVWNSATTSSKNYTIPSLPAGTYIVKVTDAKGCVEMTNNIVITNSGSTLNANFSATDAPCGESTGWINVDVLNSSAPYWITVTGPKSGTVQGTSNNTVIKNMPPGNYEVTVEKGGCTKTGWVTIKSTDNLDYVAEVTGASCGGKGSFWITINGGSPTYTVEWWHIDGSSSWQQTSSKSFAMNNMKAGEYTIKITDRNGCWKSKKVTMTGGSLDYVVETNAASCGGKGRAWVTISTGTAPYTIEYTGPTPGWKTTSSKSFALEDLAAGSYEILITDAKGCKKEEWFTISNSGGSLDYELESNGVSCGGKGSIWVTVKNGAPKYTVEWWGPNTSKWASTSNKSFQLTDLVAGDYTVKITDANGCSNTKTAKVSTTGGLEFALRTLGVSCGKPGSIWMDIKNGAPKFSVDVTGPNGYNKWFSATSPNIQLTELGAGTYTVTITDANGCKGTKSITVNDLGGNLDVALEATAATCGKTGSMWVTVKDGTPKFTVELWGPNNATFWAQTNSASFKLSELEAGDYTVKITDANGCSITKTKTVGGGTSNMHMDLEVNNAGCSSNGRIWVTVSGGTPGYNLRWSGPTVGEVNMSNSGYQINNLKAGNYTIIVKDYYGCSYSESVSVYGSGSNLKLTLESNNATCSQNGYLWANVDGGEGPYQVSYTGAKSGSFSVNNAGFQISDLPAGNYSVIVKDKNGCSVTKPTSVYNTGSNVDFSLEANNGSCGQNGYVWVTINSGNGPYQISWTGPKSGSASSSSAGYQISDLPSGVYAVTIKDKNGCQSTKNIEVKGGGLFTIVTQQRNATCGQNGEIWIDLNGGVSPFNISLTGPVIGNILTSDYAYHFPNIPGGTYTIKVQDASGCLVTKQVTISDTGSSINIAAETNDASCGQGGSAWLTMTGGTAPYALSWTGPTAGSAQTSNGGYQLTNLPSGTYTVTATDKNGCYTNKSITINNIGNNLSLSLEANDASCGQKGAIWVSIGGGVLNFNISWTGPSSGSYVSSAAGYRIENLTAGTYTVKVKDGSGCEVSKNITIKDGGSSIGLTLESTNASCGGKGSIWATVSGGTAGYSYSWTGPSTSSVSSTSTGYRIENLTAGTYSVTVKDSKGCSATKSIVINDAGSNIGLTLESSDASCGGKGSIWATISGGTAGYSYSWTGPSTGSASSSATGYRIENLTAGTYSVTVRDSKGCSATKSIIINDAGSNIGLTLESTNSTCGGKGSIWATISGGTAGYSYSWTGPSTGSASSSATGYRIENLTAGTYSVTVRDSKGCSATKSIVINDTGSNIGLTLTATNAACGGKGSVSATISGGTAGYTYTWAGPIAGSIASSATSYTIDNLTAGTYSITVKDANGCSTTKSVTVSDAGSNIGLTLQSNNASCNGKGSIYAAISGGTAGYSYSWTGPVSGSTSTSETGYRIENLPAGTYSVTVRDSKGCSATKSIIVQSVGGSLTVDLSTTTSVACEHDGTALVGIAGGTAPYTISYTGPSTGSVVSNTSNYQVSGLQPGDYVFNITDANGCAGSRKITIYDTGSDLSVSLTPSNASCGSKGTITVKITGGLSNYQVNWYGGGVTGNLTTGNSSVVLTDLPTGTYTVEVKDGIGCTVTETASVNDGGANIGLQLVPTNDVCGQGGKIEVRIDGGSPDYQIEWTGPVSGSATSSSSVYVIEGLNIAGNYNVIVKDANGCETKEWVAVNSGGDVGINLVPTASECNKSGNIVVNITSGAPDYTVSWAGPSSGSQVISSNFYRIEGLTQGTYAVTVKDNKGCETTSSTIVNANGKVLGLTLTNSNTSCGASNGSITATVSNGQGDYTYSWTGPVSSSATSSNNTYSVNDLPIGSYTITVLDKNGCSASQAISITNSGTDLGLTVVGKTASCGEPSNIQVTIGNGVPNFKIEWSGPTNGSFETSSNSYTITPVSAGEYVVRVTDASGCSKAQAVIIQSVRSDVNFTYESRAATCDQRGAIWLTIQDGSGPYNISWTGPSSGSSTSADAGVQISDLNAGTYAVTVEDKNGCSITQTIEVKNEGVGANVNFATKAGAYTCNRPGEILLTMISGTAPYTVTWSGPTTGTRTASTTDIKIENLNVGTYTVNVTGAGGCGMSSRVIEIEENRIVLGINGTVTNGVCGGKGSVGLSWTGDRDPYTITWSGAAVGSTVINEKSLTLNDLKDGDYTFTVTGFDGCSGQYQATVNNSGTTINADFTYTISGKKLAFGNLSSTGTYSWNFGDGTTSSEMNPTHTYDKNGTYQICLTVTNDCGTKEKCQSVTINAVTSQTSAAVVLGDMSGAKGAVLQLPVRVENCTKLGTLSGTISLGNNQVAQIMGLSPNAISPVYNDDNHTFSYLSSGSGMTISSETILFYINVQLIGGVGQSSTVDMSSLPVALELTCTENGFTSPITPEVGSGRVSISTNQAQLTEVGGNIKTYWGDGVVEAMVRIKSTDHEMAPMTSVSGDYTANEVPMGYEYNIAPEKTSNPANGISTFGLFLTQKYILGYDPKEIVSPYQVIAMDANCSGTLTTFDLFVMQQMLVGNLTEFPGCNSWVFVDATHEFSPEFTNMNVFPYPSSHQMMLDKENVVADFIGVKVGDILGRALPNDTDTYTNTVATDRNRQVMPLAIDQTTAKIGEIFEVTFRAQDLTEMVSFQLGLDFDPTALELVEFVANSNNELASAIAGANRNQLKISWFDPAGKATTLTKGDEFFKVKFVAKQNISNISELFAINNRTFASELHESTSDAKRFELTLSQQASTFKVYQNTPNPFMTTTTIAIEMPQTLDAEIIVHDHFGRTIQTINQTLVKGANRVELARNNLSSGIYYYTVKAGDFVDTKRMLVVE